MKILRTFLAFAVCALCTDQLRAQSNPPWAGFAVEANWIGGKVLKHTKKFVAPVPALSNAIDINFLHQTAGKRAWQRNRNFPVVGIGFTYTDYGIDSIYGKCFAVYPNIEFPIIRKGGLEWTVRVGYGGGFVTRHYERAPSWDTINTAIGSRLNNFTQFMTDLRYRVNEYVDVQVGANFSHISNAAFRQPNLGINLYGAHVGLRYYPATSRVIKNEYRDSALSNRWLVQAKLGLTATEGGFTDGPLYPVYLSSLYTSRRWGSFNKLAFGFDYSYHNKIYAFMRNNEIFPGEERQHSWKGSVFVANEFLFGRVGVWLQVGVYVKQAYLRLSPVYQKLGSNYYIVQREHGALKEIYAFGLLKTHLSQAELAEFGLGFGF